MDQSEIPGKWILTGVRSTWFGALRNGLADLGLDGLDKIDMASLSTGHAALYMDDERRLRISSLIKKFDLDT